MRPKVTFMIIDDVNSNVAMLNTVTTLTNCVSRVLKVQSSSAHMK